MGWKAFYHDGRIADEAIDARPMKDGEEGQLALITHEDYHNRIAVDLVHGAIFINYQSVGMQNGTIEIVDPQATLWVCDETNIVGDLVSIKRKRGRPTKEGSVQQEIVPVQWRPIWFTRVTTVWDGTVIHTKVIGLQTTLGKEYKNKNIKKIVSLFHDGRIGIS